MQTTQPNIEKLEGQLEHWGSKLDELVAKAGAAGQDAKTEARAHIEELKSKLLAARSKLDAAKAAGGDKWDAFKEGLESSWKELESAFKKMAS
jgi:molecular chaperone GrpE (heat shock protein)